MQQPKIVPEEKAREISDILQRLENRGYSTIAEGMNKFYEVFTPLLKGYDPSQVKPFWERYLAWKSSTSQTKEGQNYAGKPKED